MAGQSIRTRGIVVHKTKLGETDLIITLVAEDGSQLQAVAKGARKPKSSFASRLDLFGVVDLLLASGRSLAIVQESALIEGNFQLRSDIVRSAAANPGAELLWRTTQKDLPVPRLFDASRVGFQSMDRGGEDALPAFSAAMLLKTLAFIGLRPSLDVCVGCGRPRGPDEGESLWFSSLEGGLVCGDCRRRFEAQAIPSPVISWASFLLGSPYEAIGRNFGDAGVMFAILRLCQEMIRAHLGFRLKSLDFLFTCGLF